MNRLVGSSLYDLYVRHAIVSDGTTNPPSPIFGFTR